MKKFSFRLEKLLDIRKAQEREIQHELAHEVAKENVLIRKQTSLRENVARQQAIFHDEMKNHRDTVSVLQSLHRYMSYADSVIADSQRKIDSMQPKINEIRARLADAVKERRKIEKLKERKLEEWKYMVKREEEKELDEMNMKIFNARHKEEYL
ncbi:MAG: flagellar export protein FliJ [Spirochaetota bacterium]